MALAPSWPILGWARTPVAPVGGALAACAVPDLITPLITHLLQRAGVPAQAVDALILGNALGANGNPARLAALSAGLPDRVAAEITALLPHLLSSKLLVEWMLLPASTARITRTSTLKLNATASLSKPWERSLQLLESPSRHLLRMSKVL